LKNFLRWSSAIAITFISIGSVRAVLPANPTLCTPEEVAYFSCAIKGSGKIASLCGSKQIGVDGSYLQYRFGKLLNPEMQFPAENKNSIREFSYAHYFRALVDRNGIGFSNNGYRYVLFSDMETDIKPPLRERGVRVTAPGGKETTLLCSEPFIGQHWDVLESALVCDPKTAEAVGAECPGK